MRILCQYSGIEFTCSGFNQLFIREQASHPLMGADLKLLITEGAKLWLSGSLSKEEERLLFCAILKQTDCVNLREWEVPADPAVETVKKSMDRLILTAGWINVTGLDVFPIPKFTVRRETRDLKHIAGWLDAVNDARKDWETKGISWSLQQKLGLREAALLKLISSPSRKEKTYARQMAKFMLEATQAPEYIHTYWTHLFCLEDNIDIWEVPKVDFEELYEHVVRSNFDRTTVIGSHIYNRLARLIYINSRGLEASIMDDERFMTDGKEQVLGKSATFAPRFTVLQTADSRPLTVQSSAFASVEEYNTQLMIARAPKEEPQERDYPTRWKYNAAMSAWRLAKRAEITSRQLEMKRMEIEKQREKELGGDKVSEEGNLEEEVTDQLSLFDLNVDKDSE